MAIPTNIAVITKMITHKDKENKRHRDNPRRRKYRASCYKSCHFTISLMLKETKNLLIDRIQIYRKNSPRTNDQFIFFAALSVDSTYFTVYLHA